MKRSATTKSVEILVPLFLNHASLYPIISVFFASIKKHYPDYGLVVADDHSPLPLLPDWPVTWRNETNVGFTQNVNKLLSMSTTDIIVVCNDDLEFKKGDLDWVYDTKGIWFPRDSASANLDIFGAIWAIDRASFIKLGFLDESYPHYGSDREYYTRAIVRGVPVVKVDDVCILHHEGATYRHTKHRQ